MTGGQEIRRSGDRRVWPGNSWSPVQGQVSVGRRKYGCHNRRVPRFFAFGGPTGQTARSSSRMPVGKFRAVPAVPEDQMTYRVAPTALLLAASTLLTGGSLQLPQNPANPPVTVHEWGTFTSVRGEDGKAMQWAPRQAPAELPCFVERQRINLKGYLPATIRMETPGLYFYSPAQTSVDVASLFRQG